MVAKILKGKKMDVPAKIKKWMEWLLIAMHVNLMSRREKT